MTSLTEATLLTVEEFAKIPDPPGGHYELHHGELVIVPPPIKKHARAQKRLVAILDTLCRGWYADKEFAFRALPEYEVWVADVGMVPDARWEAADEDKWLDGAPELVIEVLSPSNTAQEILDRERICFQGGCQEFWVVDPNLKIIRVTTPDGISHTYSAGDQVPMDRFVPGAVTVADVFAS